MGTTPCGQCCSNRPYSSRQLTLRSTYKLRLKGSPFRHICLDTLDRYFQEDLEL
jgi:hypothetical protein